MNGIVNGGWEFVWAAYAVSAVVLVGYCAHVIDGFFKKQHAVISSEGVISNQ